MSKANKAKGGNRTVVIAAIGLAIYGWNKPGSLVRGSRVRLVLAIVLAGAQVVGWTIGLVNLALR